MEDLILSIEQCKHLLELGLDMSDAKFMWGTMTFGENSVDAVVPCNFTHKNALSRMIPTYTLQEIWEKLPELINCYEDTYYLTARKDSIYYADVRGNHYKTFDRISILYSAYEALCWVIENGYLKRK